MAAQAKVWYDERWDVDELKSIMGEFAHAVTNRLEDHDILIQLKTTQQHMLDQVNTLVGALSKTVDDHETRIRRMERLIFYGLGAIGLATTLYKLLGGKVL